MLGCVQYVSMRVFTGFEELNNYLATLMPEARSRREAYTLDAMRNLMAALGNPQNTYKVIHVAGTSGKSSTCHYLSAMLGAAGQKVGLSVSPHVYKVNERVQVNTQPLSEKKFCGEFSLFLSKVEATNIKPTYFEILVAFAFWEFAREEVDYAVIEVGVGGLLDGTNVISRADKVSVITDIGFDHTGVLGKTLTEIASQKAGIILPTSVVFSYRQREEIMQVLREVSAQNHAELHEVQPLKQRELPQNLPTFQRRNWHLAHAVYVYLADRDQLPDQGADKLVSTTEQYIPGRMEMFESKGKAIVLDAAHNPQKLSALVESMKIQYPGQSIACMVSFVQSKQTKVHDNLEVLLPGVNYLVITDFSVRNKDRKATKPLTVAEHCEQLGFQAWEIIDDPVDALWRLFEQEEAVLLIVGSFFLPETIKAHII